MRYYLNIRNKRSGPFLKSEIKEMFVMGRISQNIHCCPEGRGWFLPLKNEFQEIVNWRLEREDFGPVHLSLMLTTENNPQGLIVEERLEVVTAECAFGMNIFRDFFASVSDVFGGRSEATQKVLRDGRETVLNELKKEAYACGGNAVIGVRLDYSQMSGKGKSILFVVASGTAVKLSTEQDD